MQSLIRYGAAAGVVLALAPCSARAQVYPDRIAAKARAHLAERYQHRDDTRQEQTERTTKTVRLGANGSLALTNVAGDITVSRGGGSEATVEIVKTARARDVADAKDQLELVQVDVTELANRAEVKTRYPNGESRNRGRRNVNVSVAYNVTAPAGTHLTIESVSGTIKVTDVKGDVSATSVSGDVRISGAGRVGTAKSISGSVEITDAQVDGSLEANSISGDVTFRRIRAHRLGGATVSGNVRFEDVQCDQITAHSTSGDVFFSGPLARNGRYELKTFSGEVRLALAGNTGFEIDANSFSGDVRTEFPLTTRGNIASRGRRTHVTGTYGDGSAVLDITTFSGSVAITKK
jgi:hypothetical protein